MTNVMRGTWLSLAGTAILSAWCLAAPAAKPREEKLDPPTPEQLRKSSNNLKEIALAFHNYNDTVGTLPTNVLSKDKKPLLSWRVQILPFIEEDALYQKFKLDEPWDSDHNKKLIDKMPKLYAPVRVKTEAGMTYYQGFAGSNGMLQAGKYNIGNIPDGTSNTFMVAESAKPVTWTKPSDLEFNGKDVPALGGMFDGRFHAAMGDGSVKRFRKGVNANTLRLLIDPADGTPLPRDVGHDEDENK